MQNHHTFTIEGDPLTLLWFNTSKEAKQFRNSNGGYIYTWQSGEGGYNYLTKRDTLTDVIGYVITAMDLGTEVQCDDDETPEEETDMIIKEPKVVHTTYSCTTEVQIGQDLLLTVTTNTYEGEKRETITNVLEYETITFRGKDISYEVLEELLTENEIEEIDRKITDLVGKMLSTRATR